MAKFIVEVEEGVTQCEHCPFADSEVCDCAFEIDFYHKHHIDYRGLIPMGLAIDATGLNIY